jgi:hypothetical protein
MKWPKLKCPFCGGILANREIKAGVPLVCPSCSRKLQFSQRQLRLSTFVAVGLSVGLSLLLGLRGLWFIAATVIFWFPMLSIWEFAFVRIVPPKFEAYEDSRGSKSKTSLFGR